MKLNENSNVNSLPKYKVFGPTKDPGATLTMVVSTVIEKTLVSEMGNELDGVIFVIGNDEETLKEAISLMESNPLQKLLIIDPFGLYTMSRFATAIESYNKLSKFALSRTLTEFKTFPDEIKNAIAELKIEEDKIRKGAIGTSYKVTEKQIEFSSRILGYLKHDLPKVIKENGESYEVDERQRDRFEKLINDARDAFDMKSHVTEAQVVSFIRNTASQIKKVMEGDISGVYCDIDDTILRADGTLIESTLELIEKLEIEGHEIHIWTGGDLAIAKEKLSGTIFARFPLVSKYDYMGANAEIIIDNVSPEKFSIQTGITAKKFIRV